MYPLLSRLKCFLFKCLLENLHETSVIAPAKGFYLYYFFFVLFLFCTEDGRTEVSSKYLRIFFYFFTCSFILISFTNFFLPFTTFISLQFMSRIRQTDPIDVMMKSLGAPSPSTQRGQIGTESRKPKVGNLLLVLPKFGLASAIPAARYSYEYLLMNNLGILSLLLKGHISNSTPK